MVLFLFVIMLLDPFSATALRSKRKILGYAAILLGALVLILMRPILKAYNLLPIAAVSGDAGSIQSIGQALFNQYLLPFEITSVLILIAIIGVVVLARRKA
jgi:NADH-quinone oxidoreductase subunit J